jgi:hypothetical protein
VDWKVLYEPRGFDWDQGNAAKNSIKHGVTTEESEEVFFNQPLVVAADLEHSQTEERYYVLGETGAGRPLFIAFTVRRGKIRVISARNMIKQERRIYEKKKTAYV